MIISTFLEEIIVFCDGSLYIPQKKLPLMKKQGVTTVLVRNTNLSLVLHPHPISGEGLHVGLGTDIPEDFFYFLCAIADAIQVSKLRWRLILH